MEKRGNADNISIWGMIRVMRVIAGSCCLVLCLLLGPALQTVCRAASPEENGTDTLSVIVTSDLHFTLSDKISNLIVPEIVYADELTDAFFAEVIDLHPDVFIMTGDNTNGGNPDDSRQLASRLAKIRDAGIRLIITTGNHDLNNSTADEFAQCYYGLVETEERDASSLSYVSVAGNTAFFAMDDNTADPGGVGTFTEETLTWLEKMLEKYAAYHIVFLSHHNVLTGKGAFDSSSYRIQCEELAPMLEEHGVRLILTGHLHAQMMTQENGTYEIISAMPYGAGHMYGALQLSSDGLSYQLRHFDVARYGGEELAEKGDRAEAESLARQEKAYADYLAKKGYSAEQQEAIPDLLMQFLGWFTCGEIASHEQEILGNPFYGDMVEALWDGNYGPWIVSVMEHIPMDATGLELAW